MRVIHFVPSAFNYFDGIRTEAFALIDSLGNFGIDSDVYTMQYSAPSQSKTKNIEQSTQESQSTHRFIGVSDRTQVMQSLGTYDVVHMHCPTMGMVGKIIEWKKSAPKLRILCTYYGDFTTTDVFSIFFKWYNIYYLPKLFRLADVIVFTSEDRFRKRNAFLSENNGKSVVIDASDLFLGKPVADEADLRRFSTNDRLALKYALLYNELAEN